MEHAHRMVRHPESYRHPATYYRYLRIRYPDVDYGDRVIVGNIRRHHRTDAAFLYLWSTRKR